MKTMEIHNLQGKILECLEKENATIDKKIAALKASADFYSSIATTETLMTQMQNYLAKK